MKHENRFKLNMNKDTKRAVVVLSIIALLILIVGLVSCSMQLRQGNPPVPTQGQENIDPGTDKPGELIVDIDSGGKKQPDTENSDKEKDMDAVKDSPSEPSERPTKPAQPTAKPTTPPAKPTEPPLKPTNW